MSRVRGLDRLNRKLGKLEGLVSADVLERALTAASQEIRNDAQARAPIRTGTLRRSISTQTTEKGRSAVTVATGTDVPYARIHEYGGVVVPRNARALVFQIDGEWVMVQRVVIPARPYLRPAFDAQRDGAVATFRRAVAALVREAAR